VVLMVNIFYCTNCQKAFRFHIIKRNYCRKCKEPFVTINVPRTKYFIIQLPILIIGFVIISYSIITLSFSPKRLVEPLGVFIFGFACVLFALAFQILDNKNMENIGRDMGLQMFGTIDKESKITKTQFKLPKKQPLTTHQPVPIKKGKIIPEAKLSINSHDIFFQPNKPVKNPPIDITKTIRKKETTQIKLEELLKPKTKKKRARKIRRAL